MIAPIVRRVQRYRDKRKSVALCRRDEASSGPFGKSGLNAYRATVKSEELVVVYQNSLLTLARYRERGFICGKYPCYRLIFKRVRAYERKIVRGGVVLLVIKPVRICEVCTVSIEIQPRMLAVSILFAGRDSP